MAEKADVGEKKTESPDLLSLCHTVPLEVINLGGKGYDPAKGDFTEFVSWLQCYNVDGMNSVRDHNGRTIWFQGHSGPMVPKASKSPKTKRKIKKENYTDTKKEKLVKTEKDVPKKPDNKQRNVSKTGLEIVAADDDIGRPNTRRQSSSSGLQQTRPKSVRTKSDTKAKATRKPRRKSSRNT
ncbi:endonuclease 8-like 1 isoform X1 [Clarias magur]|uniref:Endonuclease 8-like 1 isoform X1 n=1 Tax=Clarias magur TaxID=1594786 RepID=A0A8J4XEP1_CLAMG|nr:endonuclease 8-like 1 isoform X1 [Clarias magur]